MLNCILCNISSDSLKSDGLLQSATIDEWPQNASGRVVDAIFPIPDKTGKETNLCWNRDLKKGREDAYNKGAQNFSTNLSDVYSSMAMSKLDGSNAQKIEQNCGLEDSHLILWKKVGHRF